MDITIDRRHAFYLDANDQLHTLPPYRFDRLWRGEPDAAMPQLANQRVRFAVFHVQRFTSPPRIRVEHYPVLTLDAAGNVDLDLHYAPLQADVDQLEANDYAPVPTPTESPKPTITWHPDPALRRRLLTALAPATTYRSRSTTSASPFRATEPRATYGRSQGLRALPTLVGAAPLPVRPV